MWGNSTRVCQQNTERNIEAIHQRVRLITACSTEVWVETNKKRNERRTRVDLCVRSIASEAARGLDARVLFTLLQRVRLAPWCTVSILTTCVQHGVTSHVTTTTKHSWWVTSWHHVFTYRHIAKTISSHSVHNIIGLEYWPWMKSTPVCTDLWTNPFVF